jgi:poly(A) polymerase
LFEAGEDIDDLMMLVRADVTSKNAARVRRYLAGFDRVEAKMREVEEKDRLRSFQPPVDGLEIMRTLDLPPGPAVGALKSAIEQAILDGVIPNEHDAAFGYLMEIKDEVLAGVEARGRGR